MKFVVGQYPSSLSDEEFASGEWARVPQLPVWAFQLVAPLVGLLLACSIAVAWIALGAKLELQFPPVYQPLGVMAALLIVGMMIEIACYPNFGLSSKALVGFWPSRVIFFTSYAGGLSRRRFLWHTLAPFVALAVVPLAFAPLLVTGATGWLVFSSCAASVFFGFNFPWAIASAALVPRGAIVKNKGYFYYWKVGGSDA